MLETEDHIIVISNSLIIANQFSLVIPLRIESRLCTISLSRKENHNSIIILQSTARIMNFGNRQRNQKNFFCSPYEQ